MRLTAGGIRELHWHNAAEWALMLTGKARITAIDNEKDVGVDDLWFFPTGTPHCAPSPVAFDFAMHSMTPTFKTRSGEVRIIDSRNFPVANTIAAAYVILHPGGLRELHVKDKGRMTVFFNAGKARTTDFAAGDVGYYPSGARNAASADHKSDAGNDSKNENSHRAGLGQSRHCAMMAAV
jgi:oxalate decarboxylase/phosphoglucose isomerase-like protein (cupin superfamily)